MAKSSKSIDFMGKMSSAKSGRSNLLSELDYGKLQAMVAALKNEGSKLNLDLRSLSEECEKLKEENDSIEVELTQKYGPEAISDIEALRPDSDGECSSDEQNASSENKSNDDQSAIFEFSSVLTDERNTSRGDRWPDLEVSCDQFA